MPGYLYSKNKFQEKFIKNQESLCNLKKQIQPFMLRRLKKEVLSQLPDKIETKFFIEMSEEQKKVYKTYVEDIKEKMKSTVQTFAILLASIASVSLVVGGIGIMNIMLVSVTERTSEIGLKKAIGAPKRTILAQFLTEAAVLTLLGGLIGVAGGIALAYIISAVSAVPVAISGVSILVGVVFSTLIGIIFGLLPSVKAANMNPIDALRSE